jgi:DNA-directed RNA polymerase subunit alpha
MSSQKYGKLEMPKKVLRKEDPARSNYTCFVAEPFERGFGHTLGNSLRRMMLTSLEALAIVAVRIEGILHEYMAVEGIVEDMTNILLNFKGALFRKRVTDDVFSMREPRVLTKKLEITQDDLDKHGGKYAVKLGDVVQDTYFEVVNPELHLFTVTRPFSRQIDLRVALGRGYVPSERVQIRNKTADEILIDAAFSPVRSVNYFVENTRVGQDTDFERLIIEVTTDGRLTPVEAISFASQIANRHYDAFTRLDGKTLLFDEGDSSADTDHDEVMEKLCLRIDEIELTVRSANCLSGANIDTIGELVSISERKLLEFKNFGKKSLTEIKQKLDEMKLSLGMDLSIYGVDMNNVKEDIKRISTERRGKRDALRALMESGELEAGDDDEEEDEEE